MRVNRCNTEVIIFLFFELCKEVQLWSTPVSFYFYGFYFIMKRALEQRNFLEESCIYSYVFFFIYIYAIIRLVVKIVNVIICLYIVDLFLLILSYRLCILFYYALIISYCASILSGLLFNLSSFSVYFIV